MASMNRAQPGYLMSLACFMSLILGIGIILISCVCVGGCPPAWASVIGGALILIFPLGGIYCCIAEDWERLSRPPCP